MENGFLMLNKKKIVVTGGTGRFGKVLKNHNSKKIYLFLSKKELNILKINSIKKYLNKKKPKYLIHLAGLSRPMSVHDANIEKSINLNIIGTSNIVSECHIHQLPIYLFAPVLEITPTFSRDQNIYLKEESETAGGVDFTLISHSSDIVSLDLVDHIITDQGEVNPENLAEHCTV